MFSELAARSARPIATAAENEFFRNQVLGKVNAQVSLRRPNDVVVLAAVHRII